MAPRPFAATVLHAPVRPPQNFLQQAYGKVLAAHANAFPKKEVCALCCCVLRMPRAGGAAGAVGRVAVCQRGAARLCWQCVVLLMSCAFPLASVWRMLMLELLLSPADEAVKVRLPRHRHLPITRSGRCSGQARARRIHACGTALSVSRGVVTCPSRQRGACCSRATGRRCSTWPPPRTSPSRPGMSRRRAPPPVHAVPASAPTSRQSLLLPGASCGGSTRLRAKDI